ncbi:conserved hypothetical protein [Culex quinquefasciatus]|uniref:Uncharacterized protein n=1 Tax=Culex quinquefasciatus TaxID=7176 RepID=B0X726_CULQU|nr:conserved hypothetical protein [Culex quinquefasciatus]|eukprot:XP_001865448.1 conserved hypothetical protein [Culex quinquefasciatus]
MHASYIAEIGARDFFGNINPQEIASLQAVLPVILAVATYNEVARVALCEHPNLPSLHVPIILNADSSKRLPLKGSKAATKRYPLVLGIRDLLYTLLPFTDRRSRRILPPGFHILLQVNTKSDFLRLLLHIIDESSSPFDSYTPFPLRKNLEATSPADYELDPTGIRGVLSWGLLAMACGQATPNLAHFLLGFELKMELRLTNLLQPGVLNIPSNCAKSLKRLLDGTLGLSLFPPTNASSRTRTACSTHCAKKPNRSCNDFLCNNIQVQPFDNVANLHVLN